MRDRDARIAGILYLVSIVVGFATLDYLPGRFIHGDPAATASAIVANEPLFRLAIVGDLVDGIIWLFVVLALYRLLRAVSAAQSGLMLVLGAFMQVPLYFVNASNYVAALLCATGAPFLSSFSEMQRASLTMFFLRLHHFGLLASLVFGGLWLFPFGVLVFKSRFLPKVLGIWLIANGLGWLLISIAGFAAPQYNDIIGKVTIPLLLGEPAITLWLIVMGAKTREATP
jgi:hypothetical protein